MGVSSNKAYQGQFSSSHGAIVVFYANAGTLTHWNRGRSRVHPDNWKAGWYWRDANVSDVHPAIGPFSCSRNAYKDAMALAFKSVA